MVWSVGGWAVVGGALCLMDGGCAAADDVQYLEMFRSSHFGGSNESHVTMKKYEKKVKYLT